MSRNILLVLLIGLFYGCRSSTQGYVSQAEIPSATITSLKASVTNTPYTVIKPTRTTRPTAIPTKTPVKAAEYKPVLRFQAGSPIHDIGWSSDGHLLALAMTGGLSILDAKTLTAIHEYPDISVRRVLWISDQHDLFAAGVNTYFWSEESAKVDKIAEGWVWDISFSPDKMVLAVSTGPRDGGYLYYIDHPGGKSPILLNTPLDELTGSIEGFPLAGADEKRTVFAWDLTDSKNSMVFEWKVAGQEIMAVAWSPDGKRLAAGGGKSVSLWGWPEGNKIIEKSGFVDFTPFPTIFDIAFSPEGSRLAIGGSMLTIWDMEGSLNNRFFEHEKYVSSVDWSPDGKFLASGSHDRKVKVWNVATSDLVQELREHKDLVWAVSWSPDGTRLATASHDGELIIWEVQR